MHSHNRKKKVGDPEDHTAVNSCAASSFVESDLDDISNESEKEKPDASEQLQLKLV